MKATPYAIVGVAAFLFASAGLTTAVRAQDGYDQQHWWNPGDWFDANRQDNLLSDRYWNNRQGFSVNRNSRDNAASRDRKFDSGFHDRWDYDSDNGYNDAWDNNADLGVGSAGNYESGFDSGTTGATSQGRAQTGQQVTSLRTLVQSDRPTQYVGDQVNLRKVEVQRVLNANWIMIGTGQEQQLLVRLPQAKQGLKIGDTVKLSGVVRKLPQNLDQVKLTQRQAYLAEQHDIYIEAARVNTLDQ